ncbi:Diguanylate cyclase DosC [compost metagenome]
MPAAGLGAAMATAERIRAAIEQTPVLVGQGAPVSLTLSFGVAQVHGPNDLLAATVRADKALYQSKHAGRNRVSQG